MKMTSPDHRPWPIPSPLFDTVTMSLEIRWLKPPKTTLSYKWRELADAFPDGTFSIDRQAFSFTF